ncbi:XdhC family protein [Natrialba sp. PRR66]|uniref:XdhC family protein n=1 Tax=Natrialba sp. PRR66 TaxID=3098146 RepID=UPI002B1DF740|nr:XdhC family protein [Natrialba sp. PRR66]
MTDGLDTDAESVVGRQPSKYIRLRDNIMNQMDPWSATDRDLRDALRSLRDANDAAAVVTVVDVDGSAYRRPCAKFVAPADQTALGAVTAGCLDGPVADLAAEARKSGTATVATFDLTGDEWGLGLGCNGVVDLLAEPLDDSLDPLLAALDDGEAAAVCSVVESDDDAVPVGARTVVTEADSEDGNDRVSIPADILADLQSTADAVRDAGSSTTVRIKREAGGLRVFIDGIEPVPRLVLFGSQNDVHPIARFGAQAGFRVTVASPRGARADDEQFPNAYRVRAAHPTDLPALIEDPERTYVVLLSHNLVDDRLALKALLDESDVPYIGLMGPRKRFEELWAASRDDGRAFTSSELDCVSTPVGLDLGDGSPTGIAMSVVSEVLAAANGADGGRLSERAGPIHDRPDLTR